MSILDGYETTREIHRLYSQPPAIVAMTANAMKEDVEKCLNAGMDDYLSKPVSKAMLAAMLERWSRANRMRHRQMVPLSAIVQFPTQKHWK